MNIIDVRQDTPEWLWERCGRVTASEVYRIMSYRVRGGGETQDRADYRTEIISEIISGSCTEHYVSRYMKEGKEKEPMARAAYEVHTGNDTDKVGFVVHPTIERAGASPDGLVNPDGLVEFKAPKSSTHVEYLLTRVVPPAYMDQMQFQMACTGRQWCDWVTFDDRLGPRYQMDVIRVPRDEGRIAELNDGVRLFLKEVDSVIAALNERFPELPQPLSGALDDPEFGGLGITDAEISRYLNLGRAGA